MYLMPKVGSRVSLYFSNGDERSGRGINCMGQGGENPKDRYLRSEHGKSLNLVQKELSLKSSSTGGNSIQMAGEAVNLNGAAISITANDVRISGKTIHVNMKGSLKAGCGVYVLAGPEMQLDTTAYLEMCGKDVEICGDAKTIIQTKPWEKSYPAYPDAPEEGTFNLGKAAGNAAVAVVVIGGVAVVVCVTAGTSAPVIIGAAATAGLSGAGMVATDYMKGSVSGLDDYVNAVANAELMFFTNMAATKVIKVMGLGYGEDLAVREGSMTILQ